MNAQQISNLQTQLEYFLQGFNECFPCKGLEFHLQTYVNGQLSDLPRKSVEPIAKFGGIRPRTLQEFLSHFQWDHESFEIRLSKEFQRCIPIRTVSV